MLDEALRAAAAKGQLNHLSLIAHTDRAGTVTYRVSFRDTKHDGAKHTEDADPVVAIAKALGVKG